MYVLLDAPLRAHRNKYPLHSQKGKIPITLSEVCFWLTSKILSKVYF